MGGFVRTAMDEVTFLDFYKGSIMSSSNKFQHFICKQLEAENKITYDLQCKLGDDENTLYVESKRDVKSIILKTTTSKTCMNFYEKLEYKKLYKYSVPFIYEHGEKSIDDVLKEKQITLFDYEKFQPDYIIDTMLKDVKPIAYKEDGKYFIKFVLQKAYFQQDIYERIDYRYPIVIYINPDISIIEIRYDSMRYSYDNQVDNDVYSKIVLYCIKWIKDNLELELFTCEHKDIIKKINDNQNTEVRMYKQMMDMSTGGAAELTASENGDYVLPFIGELRELIDENEELFRDAIEIKQLLLQYLNEKEATASYPYIYVKWVKPVETESYVVKITFEYFNGKYTLLQHITGKCSDLGMGRMNDAIQYLSKSGSFVKGEEV